MEYSNTNDNKEHLLKLIDFLYNEVISSGGDGDALWYSKYYNIKDLILLIKEYNNKLKWKWEVKTDNKSIFWGLNQEEIIITNDEEIYKNSPSWQQILIKY